MKHTIEVSIEPICAGCGNELQIGCLQSRPGTGAPFNRDNPGERKDQRLFVYGCTKCYVLRSELPASAQTVKP